MIAKNSKLCAIYALDLTIEEDGKASAMITQIKNVDELDLRAIIAMAPAEDKTVVLDSTGLEAGDKIQLAWTIELQQENE